MIFILESDWRKFWRNKQDNFSTVYNGNCKRKRIKGMNVPIVNSSIKCKTSPASKTRNQILIPRQFAEKTTISTATVMYYFKTLKVPQTLSQNSGSIYHFFSSVFFYSSGNNGFQPVKSLYFC